MRGFRTLDLYVLRRFAGTYVANLISFTLIFVLIDAISHFEEFFRQSEGALGALGACARYYGAILPIIFCQILGPVVAVSAALFTVTTFQRSNELVPILATGRSAQRTFLPLLAASLALSAATFLIQERWVPTTISTIREAVDSRDGKKLAKHVRYHDVRNSFLVVFREYDRSSCRGLGVEVLPYGGRGGTETYIRAGWAQWTPPEDDSAEGTWLLGGDAPSGRNVILQEYERDGRLVIQTISIPTAQTRSLYRVEKEHVLKTTLRPGDIDVHRDESVYMTLSQLRRKAETAPDQSGWLAKYLSRFTFPPTGFILVLLGIPAIIYFGNSNIFVGALLAAAISTAYFVSNSVLQDLGVRGILPVGIAVGLAPCLFTAIGVTFYRAMRS